MRHALGDSFFFGKQDSDSVHEQIHPERSCTIVHRPVIAAVSVAVSRYCHAERIALLANYALTPFGWGMGGRL